MYVAFWSLACHVSLYLFLTSCLLFDDVQHELQRWSLISDREPEECENQTRESRHKKTLSCANRISGLIPINLLVQYKLIHLPPLLSVWPQPPTPPDGFSAPAPPHMLRSFAGKGRVRTTVLLCIGKHSRLLRPPPIRAAVVLPLTLMWRRYQLKH